jgi:hypothetical protein
VHAGKREKADEVKQPEFWILIFMQEIVSVFKNVGWSDDLYSLLRQCIGRPISQTTRDAMEEKRQVIAPCDNIAEIACPVILYLVIVIEDVFDVLPGVHRAPYSSSDGILGAWMGDRQRKLRGETRITLLCVFVIRIIFCLIEYKLRELRHKYNSTKDGVCCTLKRDEGSDGSADNHTAVVLNAIFQGGPRYWSSSIALSVRKTCPFICSTLLARHWPCNPYCSS